MITKQEINLLKKNEDKIPEEHIKEYIYWRAYYDFNFFEDYFFWHFKEKNWKKIKPAKFHKEMNKDLLSWKNLLWIMFRMSWKTTKAIVYIIYSIVYKKHKFITFYAFDKAKAKSKIFWLVSELIINKRLKAIYWEIYPVQKIDKDSLQKKSIWEFITTNWIKVKAFWINESPRWELHITSEWAYRPDLVLFDDIDVEKSVNNKDIIDKNYQFIKWEVLGWLDRTSRIIFLWNIIKQDWLVPRFEKEFKKNKRWIVRRKAVKENWKIVWSYFTEKLLKEFKEDQGEIAFNQNYLLIPYVDWQVIIWREYIQYVDILPPKLEYYIWIDPAISEKETSDAFAIVVAWYDRKSKNYYIVESIALNWKQKEPFKATQIIKNLYIKYRPRYLVVETVAFQKVMSKLLKAEWMAVKDYKTTKDKITRLREKQYLFEQQRVFFTNNNQELIEQLVNFPNVKNDDLVDAMLFSLEDKRNAYDVLLNW